jgi:hypothetical protein
MGKLATLFGLICTAANGILVSLSIVHAGLIGLCVAMMEIDKNPESTWNCGVLIYGAEALILFLISLPFFFLAKFTLWTNPLKTTTWLVSASFVFLVSAGSYCYAFLK